MLPVGAGNKDRLATPLGFANFPVIVVLPIMDLALARAVPLAVATRTKRKLDLRAVLATTRANKLRCAEDAKPPLLFHLVQLVHVKERTER